MNVKGSSIILSAMMVNFFVFFVQMWLTIITINSGPQKKARIGTISIRINKVINALVVIVAINSISSILAIDIHPLVIKELFSNKYFLFQCFCCFQSILIMHDHFSMIVWIGVIKLIHAFIFFTIS